MSPEAYVLSDKRLSSIREWQQAIDSEGFKLALSNERPFEALQGYFPVRLESTPVGFECDHWDAAELIQENSDLDFGHQWNHAIAFRWGADLDACLGAYMAATAYARATGGVVLDCEAGRLLTARQARDNVVKMERDLPVVKDALRKIFK